MFPYLSLDKVYGPTPSAGLGSGCQRWMASLRECVVSPLDVEALSFSWALLRALIKTSGGKSTLRAGLVSRYWVVFCSRVIVLAETRPGLSKCDFFISGFMVVPFLL